MADLVEALRSGRVLLMDGAMGTELQRAGIGAGECYELWSLTHPARVRAIHQAYANAGAEVFLTNTFQANPANLSRHVPPHELLLRLGEIPLAALALARVVAGPDGFVLFDVGPFTDEGRRWAAGCAVGQAKAGRADGLLMETCSGIADTARVVKDKRRSDIRRENLHVLMSWTYRRAPDGSLRTIQGQSPEACARAAAKLDLVALGVNCGRDVGMAEVIEVIRRYRDHTDLPLFARPNAGTPRRVGDRWVYPHTPEAMAGRLPELLEAGVSMVGGCCGTTPEHIAAFRPVVAAWNARRDHAG
jgi:5-methyltetrahydrofolate--homocysteine methyltransferase